MIIQSASVGMASSRKYSSSQKSFTSITAWNNNKGQTYSVSGEQAGELLGEKPSETGYLNAAKELINQEETKEQIENPPTLEERLKKANKDLMDAYNVNKTSVETASSKSDTLRQIRLQTLDYLLYILFGKKMEVPKKEYFTCEESSGMTTEDISDYTSLANGSQEAMSEEDAIGGSYYNYFEYHESETTTFNTTGTVVTGDGQEINFNVSMTMSRSFSVASSTMLNFGANHYCDPLVINLDCNASEVTDQKFYFDLDMDGEQEAISRLGAGSGFLALDKNGDGVINDGSELFGAGSGNGFADLAQYDSDGNGWIDEADEIFKRLVVWTMDENGGSKLCDLKETGVGAIYLGSADTEFALKGAGNVDNAMIRQTGVFLYENGGVGSIQQLDMAT